MQDPAGQNRASHVHDEAHRHRTRRGRATRLEGLTDAVFGFAITLLVVSLEVPSTFDELMATMRGFLAFACSFALLVLVWWYHYRLFSRYRLDDGYTVFLNSALLFVVLFYVYPLKFVFTAWLGPDGGDMFSSGEQTRWMMTVYGIGFMAVFIVFALLYKHVIALRERHELGPLDVSDARAQVGECMVMIGVGLLSIAAAWLMPLPWSAPVAGFIYFLIGPAQFLNGRYHERRKPRMVEPEAMVPDATVASDS